MKLENNDEKEAFEFICKLASERTDRICNDLEPEDEKKFKHLKVKTFDMDTEREILTNVEMDFDVIQWLKDQIELVEAQER